MTTAASGRRCSSRALFPRRPRSRTASQACLQSSKRSCVRRPPSKHRRPLCSHDHCGRAYTARCFSPRSVISGRLAVIRPLPSFMRWYEPSQRGSIERKSKARAKRKKAARRGGHFGSGRERECCLALCGSGGDRLSRALRHSTMGAGVFNGRVRDGIGFWARRSSHQTGATQGADGGAVCFCSASMVIDSRCCRWSCLRDDRVVNGHGSRGRSSLSGD